MKSLLIGIIAIGTFAAQAARYECEVPRKLSVTELQRGQDASPTDASRKSIDKSSITYKVIKVKVKNKSKDKLAQAKSTAFKKCQEDYFHNVDQSPRDSYGNSSYELQVTIECGLPLQMSREEMDKAIVCQEV